MITLHPSFTNRFAVSLPIPEFPPVMTANLSEMFFEILHLPPAKYFLIADSRITPPITPNATHLCFESYLNPF